MEACLDRVRLLVNVTQRPVLAVISGTESLTMQCIRSLESRLGLIWRDPHDGAFGAVKFHPLCFLLLFKGKEVILEFFAVILVGYSLEKETVMICKEVCI